jgi:hypothetical protein
MMSADANVIDFELLAAASAKRRKATSTLALAELFQEGYRDGRSGVDELSIAAAHQRGFTDAAASRVASTETANLDAGALGRSLSLYEQAAYDHGWDAGWQDAEQDAYRRGYSEGFFARAIVD